MLKQTLQKLQKAMKKPYNVVLKYGLHDESNAYAEIQVMDYTGSRAEKQAKEILLKRLVIAATSHKL